MIQPAAALLSAFVAMGILIGPNWHGKSKKEPWEVMPGHFEFEDAATLTEEQAAETYARIAAELQSRYDLTQFPEVKNYQRWHPAVRNVYQATAHGNRYHNVLVNTLARDYLNYRDAGTLPAGSLVFKDSFTVNKQGEAFPGTLAVMEKMPPGFYPRSGDWRFTLVMPDGSILGRLKGEGSERVEFCVDCHIEAKEDDYLFFPPENYRLEDPG